MGMGDLLEFSFGLSRLDEAEQPRRKPSPAHRRRTDPGSEF
jgi:hypothetical protein